MKEMIKRTAVVSIITSLIFAVLGIVMIANPEAAIEPTSSHRNCYRKLCNRIPY